MTADERARRTADADALCAKAWEDVGGPDTGLALVAVGGYGRAELAPHSDLDVVLVSDLDGTGADDKVLRRVAEQVWYPLWDSGANIDHSVRTLPEMVSTADTDLRVALGLLDVRHLTGDPNLTLRLRTTMLTHWRRSARDRLPELHKLVRSRHDLMGELAHESVPDLKEAEGGVRDATALKALVATWLVDVPHVDLERSRMALLDVRDLVHDIAGRATDRVAPEMWSELGHRLGVAATRAPRRCTCASSAAGSPTCPGSPGAGSTTCWRGRHRSRPRAGRRWPRSTRAWRSPAARSCWTGAPGRPRTRSCCSVPPRPPPSGTSSWPRPPLRAWPASARRCPTRGRPRRGGCWSGCSPRVGGCSAPGRRSRRPARSTRSSPSGSGSGCCRTPRRSTGSPSTGTSSRPASRRPRLIRQVARPDVLMVAALLHDIGKGSLTEHSVAGEPIARAIATRMGFDARVSS